MTETAVPRPPLGVGEIVGNTFSVVLGNFGKVLAITMLPALALLAINFALMGPIALNSASAMMDPEAAAAISPVVNGIVSLLSLVFWGITAAALARAVHDLRTTGQASIGTAFGTAISTVLPVLLLVIIVTVVFALGFVALIVPGLYIAALWFVVIPAAVIERIGLRALGRSAELSRGYRWPLVGLILIYGLLMIILSTVAFGLQFLLVGLGTPGMIGAAVLAVLFSAVMYGFGGAITAVAYGRLREIKEGTSADNVAAVFE